MNVPGSIGACTQSTSHLSLGGAAQGIPIVSSPLIQISHNFEIASLENDLRCVPGAFQVLSSTFKVLSFAFQVLSGAFECFRVLSSAFQVKREPRVEQVEVAIKQSEPLEHVEMGASVEGE